MANVYRLSYPHTNNRLVFFTAIRYFIFLFKNKMFPEVSEYPETWYNTITLLCHNNDVTCFLDFYFSHRLVWSIWDISFHIQSNFGRSNSPVSNTRDRSNSFVGPGNFPIHLMLKYTPGSNSDGSNSRTQSTVHRVIIHIKTLWWLEPSNSKHGPQGDFSCKNAMMARYFFAWISHALDLSSLLFS